MNSEPSRSKASPLATMCCEPSVLAAWRPVGVIVTVAGGAERGSRPMPPTPVASTFTSLTIGWTRNTSCGVPSSPMRHTRP